MVPITVDTANRYLFVYTEISTNPKIKTFIQNRNFTQFRMDIKKITDFKPDTELRSENPFERTEIDRAKKRYDEPEAKKSKIVSSRAITMGGYITFGYWLNCSRVLTYSKTAFFARVLTYCFSRSNLKRNPLSSNVLICYYTTLATVLV